MVTHRSATRFLIDVDINGAIHALFVGYARSKGKRPNARRALEDTPRIVGPGPTLISNCSNSGPSTGSARLGIVAPSVMPLNQDQHGTSLEGEKREGNPAFQH